MRRDSRRLALVLAAAVLAGCPGGGGERPLRIGVVVDCTGIFRSLEDAELSGAALPLIERGARLTGRRAAEGLTPARVAGRRVEIVRGCTEASEFSTFTTELRRLAEREQVDVVVAAGVGADEIVLRDVARSHPRTLFVAVAHGPREATLIRPAPNLYRFVADHAQGVAGLASYAYHRLGWRRATVALGDWDAGWGARDAFVAEFCSLGGRITRPRAVPLFDPSGDDVERIPRDVDGVAVFATPFFGPTAFMRRLARRVGEPAREIVVGPGLVDDPALLATIAVRSTASSRVVGRLGRMHAYLRAFARVFPGVPARVAAGEPVSGYRDAMEAVLRALERAGGDAARLPAELAGLQRRPDRRPGAARRAPSGGRVDGARAHRRGRRRHAGAGGDDRGRGPVDRRALAAVGPAGHPAAACRPRREPPPWAG